MEDDKKDDKPAVAPAESTKPVATQMFAAMVDGAADIAKGMLAAGRAAGAMGVAKTEEAVAGAAKKAQALVPKSVKQGTARKVAAKKAAKKPTAKKSAAKRQAGKRRPREKPRRRKRSASSLFAQTLGGVQTV